MKKFIKAFKKHLRFYPYLPGQVIEVGSYGIMKGKGFHLLGKIPFPFETKLTEFSPLQKYEFNQGVSVGIGSELVGNAGEIVGTEFKMNFERENSYSVNATLCASDNMVDPHTTLGAGFAKMIGTSQWDPRWVIVTAVKKSRNTVWAASKNRGTEVVVDCNVKGLKTLGDLIKLEAAKISVHTRNTDVITYSTDSSGDSILGFELMQYRNREVMVLAKDHSPGPISHWELVEYNETDWPE